MSETSIVPIERIEGRILLIRGQRVILDADLAELYGVETRRLNEQVKRNADRFPDDFMFRLGRQEWSNLMSQFATSSSAWGGRRKLPYAFTEHGAIMAANVLNSPRAVHASVLVVRAFVRLRRILASHKDLARKLDALERKYDAQFKVVFDAIRELMTPPKPANKKNLSGFIQKWNVEK
jgi:hypothetical protein